MYQEEISTSTSKKVGVFIGKIFLSLFLGIIATIFAALVVPVFAILLLCYIPAAAVDYVWHGNGNRSTDDTFPHK